MTGMKKVHKTVSFEPDTIKAIENFQEDNNVYFFSDAVEQIILIVLKETDGRTN